MCKNARKRFHAEFLASVREDRPQACLLIGYRHHVHIEALFFESIRFVLAQLANDEPQQNRSAAEPVPPINRSRSCPPVRISLLPCPTSTLLAALPGR